MANEATNKEPQHIDAGEVVAISYKGENKPCERVLAILLHPITQDGTDIKDLHLLYSFDTDKEEFLPQCSISDVNMSINVVTKDVKAWYFEQIMAMLERMRKEAKQ